MKVELQWALKYLSSQYVRARRETDELQRRLETLNEVDTPDDRERVERSLQRSSVVSAERLRALELVLSSCVAETGRGGPSMTSTPRPAAGPVTHPLELPKPVESPNAPEPVEPVRPAEPAEDELLEQFSRAPRQTPPPPLADSPDPDSRGSWAPPD